MAGTRPRVVGHDPVEAFDATDENGRICRVLALRQRLAFPDGGAEPGRGGRFSFQTGDSVPVHATQDAHRLLLGRSGLSSTRC